MDNHKDLKKMVVIVIKDFECKRIQPTAKDLFRKVSEESPRVGMKGFRSFVAVINAFPGIKKEKQPPYPTIYKSK